MVKIKTAKEVIMGTAVGIILGTFMAFIFLFSVYGSPYAIIAATYAIAGFFSLLSGFLIGGKNASALAFAFSFVILSLLLASL